MNIKDADLIQLWRKSDGTFWYINGFGTWTQFTTGGNSGNFVQTVTGDPVDNTDPFNPIINLAGGVGEAIGFDPVDALPSGGTGKVNFGITTTGNFVTRANVGEQQVSNSVLKKTFTLNSVDIEDGYSFDFPNTTGSSLILPVFILFNFNVNGGAGIVWENSGVLRIDGGGGTFLAAASSSFFGDVGGANRVFPILSTNTDAAILQDVYTLSHSEPFTSIDPLTTLTIDFYYILQ
jgi:hypothetical protein